MMRLGGVSPKIYAGHALPPGARLYVFDGRATGHGRLQAGTPIPLGDPAGYDVGGCVVHAVAVGPSTVYVVGARQSFPDTLDGTDQGGRPIPAAGVAGGWQELRVPAAAPANA